MNSDQKQLVLQLAEKKQRPDSIAAVLTRKYGSVFTALQVQEFIKNNMVKSEAQKQRQSIQEQLTTHDGEMRYLRDRLRQEFDREDTSIKEKVELAREIRQNISAMQKIAAMSDEKGEFSVVLVVNDQPQTATVIDVESKSL